MKVSTPKSRQDLHIKRRDRVLEVGPGNRPSFRANVLVEKFPATIPIAAAACAYSLTSSWSTLRPKPCLLQTRNSTT